jgi:hypothetical protein
MRKMMNNGQGKYLGHVMCYAVIRLSLRWRVGFEPSPFHPKFLSNKVAGYNIFLEHLDFPLSVLFHKLCLLLFHSSLTDVT